MFATEIPTGGISKMYVVFFFYCLNSSVKIKQKQKRKQKTKLRYFFKKGLQLFVKFTVSAFSSVFNITNFFLILAVFTTDIDFKSCNILLSCCKFKSSG